MAEEIQAYCAAAQVIATLVIAWLVHNSGKTIAKSEYTRNTHEMFNVLNTSALAGVENLRAVTKAADLDQYASTDEDRWKIWVTFIRLNSLQTQFLGAQSGLMDPKFANRSLGQFLDPIISDPLLYRLVTERSYHPDFVELCVARRKELARS